MMYCSPCLNSVNLSRVAQDDEVLTERNVYTDQPRPTNNVGKAVTVVNGQAVCLAHYGEVASAHGPRDC